MVPPRHHPGAGRPGALSSSPPFRLRSAKFSGIALQDLRKAFKIRLQMVCVFIMNRMNSQSSGFTQRKRMALGIVILLLVDVIWVASSELTSYVFTQYNKPFFSTFAKTSMFVLYLLGFIVWKPWRQQCTKGFRGKHATFFADAEGYFAACTTDTTMNSSLSEPLYVPVKFHDLPSEKPENTSIDTEKIVMYGCESWTKKKAECERTEAFELWCWRRLLRILWTARRSNQLILKGISPEYSLEGLVLKLKLQYFGHLMRRTNSLEKTLMLGKVEGRRRRGPQRTRWLDGITD